MFYGEVFKALNKAKVKYVVAGGVAVVLHGYRHYPKNLDLCVLLKTQNLERSLERLKLVGYLPKEVGIKEQKKAVTLFNKNSPACLLDICPEKSSRFVKTYKNRIERRIENISVPTISKTDNCKFIVQPNLKPHKHLEYWVKNTTYADRLRWLEEANEFVRLVEKSKKRPAKKK